MKNKIYLIILLSLMSASVMAQYNYRNTTVPQKTNSSYFKIGTQIGLQHSLIYDHRITDGFSINAGLGLIASPYTGMTFSNLERKGLISAGEHTILDRSFRSGITYQLGANFHFEKNYVRVFGQLAHLNAKLPITDLANLYLKTNIPPFADFLNPIDIKSNIPMVGLLYGRRFSLGPKSEIHAEASISKTLGHNTTYRTGTFIDNIGIVNDIAYSGIDNDLDRYFKNSGWFPSLNVYYVYKF
jgi:hypothetical protein